MAPLRCVLQPEGLLARDGTGQDISLTSSQAGLQVLGEPAPRLMMTFCIPLTSLLWLLGRGEDFQAVAAGRGEGESVEPSGLISQPAPLPVKVTVPA